MTEKNYLKLLETLTETIEEKKTTIEVKNWQIADLERKVAELQEELAIERAKAGGKLIHLEIERRAHDDLHK